ncbi:MAG TPA: NUDIX domain-containing protein [Solirubrobacteraceae bacterium]|jgi:ADP-ribose pyrophosphatase YjhB (NUDIX family)
MATRAEEWIRYCWRCARALPAAPPTTCAGCGQAHYLNPAPCGEAVVVRDEKVLLLRRANDPYRGSWDVPGGFCESDEHPMRAAERELAEELGLAGYGWFALGELPADLAFPDHARPMLAAAAALLHGTAGPLPDRTW